MMRKPIFWTLFGLVVLVCVFFAWNYFPQAFPIVNLDIKMDRSSALEKAENLATWLELGPAEYKQASDFHLDREVQHFAELELGGSEAFTEMLQSGVYAPYIWRVRHFKEEETREVMFRFTPDGTPYGFVEKLPEEMKGPALIADSALAIARVKATQHWNLDLSEFELIEQSQESMVSERVDHTFTYERKDIKIGEGEYRLKLVVSGDELTELTHYVRIPEAFSREYQEMRSANETIAQSAIIAAILLYVIGGCIIGLFLLMRQNWVLWRAPLFIGLFIGLMMTLETVNSLPLAWMNYDTALSTQNFMMQQVLQWVLVFIGETLLIMISVMAAESLTRKAFPNHIQLWKVKGINTTSPQVAGRTISGYLLVGIIFAFDILLYFIAQKVFGWWTPSEALFNPDILANYMPWLSSIAISLHAGVLEECLFRAIPIAGAVLLGRKFGKTYIWLIAAFIIQALIFGAGHANYPQQPSYARVVELFIPSLIWGFLYLHLGLLTVIVLHFAIDVLWIAFPLFVAQTPGIWINQLIVILVALIPIWYILYNRFKTKKWIELNPSAYNRSWQPSEPEKEIPVEDEATVSKKLSGKLYPVFWVAGLIGLIAWFMTISFDNDSPSLNLTRAEAENTAIEMVKNEGFELSDSWTTMSTVQSPLNLQDRFIWQTAGDSMYHLLMGKYLAPPRWWVRFAQFEGDIAERAEEWNVFLAGDHYLARTAHTLPEARKDTTLNENSARQIASDFIFKTFGQNTEDLKAISAESSKKPERLDWSFTFADTSTYPLAEGETRITVELAGDDVVSGYRFVHVPEEWERNERDQRTISRIVQISTTILVIAIFIFGIVRGIIHWTKKHFSVKAFIIFSIGIFLIQIISLFNAWPSVQIQFMTSQPFANQNIIALAFAIIGILFFCGGMGILTGLVQTGRDEQQTPWNWNDRFSGIGLGLVLAGTMTLIRSFAPSLSPAWAEYDSMSSVIPILEAGTSPVIGFITSALLLLFIVTLMNQWTAHWTKRQWIIFPLFILIGLVITGDAAATSIGFWLLSGCVRGLILILLYIFALRIQLSWIPVIAAIPAILSTIQEGIMQAWPGALTAAILGSILIAIVAEIWSSRLSKS